MVFRVFDDGVGFRYEFPEQAALTQVNIVEELTEFAIAEPATAWWIPGGEWNRYEYLYNKTPLAEAVAGAHAGDAEARERRAHRHSRSGAGRLRGHVAARVSTGSGSRRCCRRRRAGRRCSRTAPFVTPWRTLQIADDAPGLYMSDLILNLNEPNKLGDVSWVKPFKYVGIWWGMHLGIEHLGLGPEAWRDHGRNEALHRFRRGQWFSRRAGGRLEQGLGWRLVRAR